MQFDTTLFSGNRRATRRRVTADDAFMAAHAAWTADGREPATVDGVQRPPTVYQKDGTYYVDGTAVWVTPA